MRIMIFIILCWLTLLTLGQNITGKCITELSDRTKTLAKAIMVLKHGMATSNP
jgi:hypothetical protein